MKRISTLLLTALTGPALLWAQIPTDGLAAIRDITPPTADLNYSSTEIRCGDELMILATFSEPMLGTAPIYLQMAGAVSGTVPMTRVSEDIYICLYPVPCKAGTVNLSLFNGTDLWGNEIIHVPASGESFEIAALNLSTSIEMNGLAGVMVYPNPVDDLLRIEGMTNRTEARIYSGDGQLQQTRILENAMEEIDVSALSAGFYILRMDTGETTGWRRFVKN
jgi:hypothetical protein